MGATAGVNASEFALGELLCYSHSSALSNHFLPSIITENVPWRNPRKRQKGTSWVGIWMKHQHGWGRFRESDDVPPFMLTTVTYPPRAFEDLEDTGRFNNTEMISRSWESMGAEFTTRLPPSVTVITLNFGMMLVTYDQTLQSTHTEALLDSLTCAILHSCR